MLKRKVVETSLERKGFQRKEGDHSFFIYYAEDGKKTPIRTKTSHGTKSKDLSDRLVSLMANQCKISKADFELLIQCPLTRSQYEKKLKESGNL